MISFIELNFSLSNPSFLLFLHLSSFLLSSTFSPNFFLLSSSFYLPLSLSFFLSFSLSLFYSFPLTVSRCCPLTLSLSISISLYFLPSLCLAPSLCISNRLPDPDYQTLGVNQSADVIINAATETKGILGFLNAARKTPLNTTQPVLAANPAPALIPVIVEGI